MNAAIQQRVEQFVREILAVVQQASEVSRAAALSVVSTMLAGMGRPPRPGARAPSERRQPASRGGSSTSRKAVASPRKGQLLRRGARPIVSEAVVPTAVTPSTTASAPSETAGPSTRRRARPKVVRVAVAPSSPMNASNEIPSPATTSGETVAPAPEREALVLEAVRVLVRATASEVAERSGQPNGSVGVALRALVARGQVAKTRTARGAEYSLVSTGSVRPFKRVKRAGAADAPTLDQASAADVA